MGTSSSGSGAAGGNPLIPSWIGGGGPSAPPPQPPPPDNQNQTNQPDGNDPQNQPNQGLNNGNDPSQQSLPIPVPSVGGMSTGGSNRFTGPRKQFNKFVRSRGADASALKNALKGYSKKAAGSTSGIARRMQPSAIRVSSFYETIDTIKRRGLAAALTEFNLTAYANRPALEVLSAISDVVFRDTGRSYENTQDDSLTKAAYSNTVTRICEESPDINLDTLTNEQIEVMMAIFIEETIAQRVINDIGNEFTETVNDVEELVKMENNIYQIVSGLVRNQIMPEISATRRGDQQDLERKIENIYRIAFDAMAGTKD
jgi:hypothetical protein